MVAAVSDLVPADVVIEPANNNNNKLADRRRHRPLELKRRHQLEAEHNSDIRSNFANTRYPESITHAVSLGKEDMAGGKRRRRRPCTSIPESGLDRENGTAATSRNRRTSSSTEAVEALNVSDITNVAVRHAGPRESIKNSNESSTGALMESCSRDPSSKPLSRIPSDVQIPEPVFEDEGFVHQFFQRFPKGVEAIAFSPDDCWLAVGRSDGQIDIFDCGAASAQEATLFMSLPAAESQSVRALMFANSTSRKLTTAPPGGLSIFGFRLFSSGLNGTVTEWDLLSMGVKNIALSHGGAVFDACLSDSLGLIATGSDDGSVRLIRIRRQSGQVTAQARGSSELGPVTTDNDDDVDVLQFWKSLIRHQSRILSVCFYGDKYCFAGSSDSTILKWNLVSGVCEARMSVGRRLKPQESAFTPSAGFPRRGTSQIDNADATARHTHVWALIPLESSELLASGDSAGNVILWDVGTATALKTFTAHEGDVLKLTASPNQPNCFFSAGIDGRLTAFTSQSLTGGIGLGGWNVANVWHPHEGDIRAMAMSRTGRVATGATDTEVRLLQSTASGGSAARLTARQLTTLPSFGAPTASSWVSSAAKGGTLTIVTHSQRVDLWALQGSSVFDAVDANPEEGSTSHFAADPQEALCLASIKLNDKGATRGIRCAALSPNGELIAISNDTGTRLFAFDLEEVNLAKLPLDGASRHVCTALQFVSVHSSGSNPPVEPKGSQLPRSGSSTTPQWLVCAVAMRTTSSGLGGFASYRRLIIWDVSGVANPQKKKEHRNNNMFCIVAKFSNLPCAVQRIEVSADLQWMAALTIAGQILVYSLDRMKIVVELPQFPLSNKFTGGAGAMSVENPSCPGSATFQLPGAMAFSPDSRFLAVARRKPRLFFIVRLSNLCLVDASDVTPTAPLETSHAGILKMSGLPCTRTEVGTLRWVSSSTTPSGTPEAACMTRPRERLDVLLVATTKTLATIRFAVRSNSNRSAEPLQTEAAEVALTRPPAAGTPQTAGVVAVDSICRVQRELTGTILSLAVTNSSGPADGAPPRPRILIFMQPKRPAPNSLPAVFQRKRFGAT